MFRPIYEPRNRAREYCDLAINIYDGCSHGCTYCYARKMASRFRIPYNETPKPREDIVEAVRLQIERGKIRDKKIMLCFTCDPYPADVDTMGTIATREVIKAIKNTGNYVQILTKGGEEAQRDFDILDAGDSFGVTITGGGFTREPGAAIELDRLENLMKAKERGISTWVSMEPVYSPDIIYKIITVCDYIDMFRIGKLNYEKSDIDWAEFGIICEQLCRRYSRNYYLKEDLRALMEAPTP